MLSTSSLSRKPKSKPTAFYALHRQRVDRTQLGLIPKSSDGSLCILFDVGNRMMQQRFDQGIRSSTKQQPKRSQRHGAGTIPTPTRERVLERFLRL